MSYSASLSLRLVVPDWITIHLLLLVRRLFDGATCVYLVQRPPERLPEESDASRSDRIQISAVVCFTGFITGALSLAEYRHVVQYLKS